MPKKNTQKRLSISSNEFDKMSVKELREFTLNYYKNHFKGKVFENKERLISIDIVSRAGNKICKPIYKEKVAVLKHLKSLIENSTYNNFGKRKQTDSEDILGYLNFKSKITVDKEPRHVRISIIINKRGNFRFKSFDLGKKKG